MFNPARGTPFRPKQTAGNNAFLRAAKAEWNKPIYAKLLAIVNESGEAAARQYLARLTRTPTAADHRAQPVTTTPPRAPRKPVHYRALEAPARPAPEPNWVDSGIAIAEGKAASLQPIADAVSDEINNALAVIDAAPPARRAKESDGDYAERLVRRVVRAAERWQRKFPAPPCEDEPELYALWIATEYLVAHDEGRAPTVDGDQTPRTREGIIALARKLVPAELIENNGRIATAPDALNELTARATLLALERAGLRTASILSDIDGAWGVQIWL